MSKRDQRKKRSTARRSGGAINDIINAVRDELRDHADPGMPFIETTFRKHGVVIYYDHGASHNGLIVIRDTDAYMTGIIIDARDDFRILVAPKSLCDTSRNSVDECMQNAGEYDMFNAVDGTMVTLYYVPRMDTWLIATARSYDARDYRWLGERTYSDAIRDAGIDFEKLQRDETYTIIFRDSSFHPMYNGPTIAWQISGPAIGGSVMNFAETCAATCTMDEAMANAGRALAVFTDGGAPNFGYIFIRRGDPERRMIYLQSSLQRLLRKIAYNIPPGMRTVDWKTRNAYIHLRTYLSCGDLIARSTHELIIPAARDIFTRMDLIISALVQVTSAVMRAARSKGARASPDGIIRNTLGAAATDELVTKITKISNAVAERMIAEGRVNAFSQYARRNIMDKFINIGNIDTFISLIL